MLCDSLRLQINGLEIRIEKMQEMFNMDLEEIKNSQSIMNNAITEIKNTLELPRASKTQVGTAAWHSSTLAWNIPWMEEPSRLKSMGLQRVRHD